MTAMDHAAYLMFMMIAGHAIADQPLQTDFIHKMKTSPGWCGVQGLAIHGLIHGFFVGAITGMWQLCVAETLAHALIDKTKGAKRINHVTDQALHMACKLIWMIIAINC